MEETLLEKLRSLGVTIGAGETNLENRRRVKYPIENVIDGKVQETKYGNTFYKSISYSKEYLHGQCLLSNEYSHKIMSICLKIPELVSIRDEEIIFIDTETSGLSGGAGTFVFLVGVGYFLKDEFHIQQYFLRSPAEEQSMLESLTKITDNFQGIVSFNGKAFDVPLLNRRYILNELSTPFNSMYHIDILHLARRIWKNRLTSRTLAVLESDIIGFTRSQGEVPGWMVPEIYLEYLHSGDARSLVNVFYHNEIDVLSLAVLYGYLNGLLENPIRFAGTENLDLLAIARMYEQCGLIDSAIELYEYSLVEKALPREFFIESLTNYASIYKRKKTWEKAIEIWCKLAEYHQINACIELAKYYEHQCLAYGEAIQWVNRAIEDLLLERSSVENERQMREIEHRKNRLERKLKNARSQ